MQRHILANDPRRAVSAASYDPAKHGPILHTYEGPEMARCNGDDDTFYRAAKAARDHAASLTTRSPRAARDPEPYATRDLVYRSPSPVSPPPPPPARSPGATTAASAPVPVSQMTAAQFDRAMEEAIERHSAEPADPILDHIQRLRPPPDPAPDPTRAAREAEKAREELAVQEALARHGGWF